MRTVDKADPESVLIVDDASIVRAACERALLKAGYEVRTAENGADALEKMSERPARAVLLDVKMPVMNGLEFMRVLSCKWPSARAVIMTAFLDNAMVGELERLGAVALAPKPFEDIRRVVRAVGAAVVRSRLADHAPIVSETLLRAVLAETGWMGNSEFDRAVARAREQGKALGDCLLENKIVEKEDLEWALAEFLQVACVRTDPRMIEPALAGKLPPEMARRLTCLPLFEEDGRMHMVIADPFDENARQELEETFNKPVALYKGRRSEIETAIAAVEAGRDK